MRYPAGVSWRLVDNPGPIHMSENVWSAARLQGKAEDKKASLRKCIRPLVEINSPGHDELRACLSL